MFRASLQECLDSILERLAPDAVLSAVKKSDTDEVTLENLPPELADKIREMSPDMQTVILLKAHATG